MQTHAQQYGLTILHYRAGLLQISQRAQKGHNRSFFVTAQAQCADVYSILCSRNLCRRKSA